MTGDRIVHDNPHDMLGTPLPAAREIPRSWVVSAVVDAVAVVVFAAVGRRSHAEGVDLAGVLATAWPFLAGLAVAWLALRAHRRSRAVWPTGVGVWLLTWGVGMALRAATSAGTATAFMLVAAAFLGATLVGWRALARITRGRSLLPGLAEH